MAVMPAISVAARYALRARFLWNKSAYETAAAGIRSGTRSESLGPHERALGSWVRAERPIHARGESEPDAHSEPGPIDVVHFMVVSYGFAGHVGFARAFGRSAQTHLLRGHGFGFWRHSAPLGDGWFVVSE